MRALALLATVESMDGTGPRSTLEAAQSGDLAAFELLMRQYERLVLVTAMRLLGNLEDAKDVSQDVFLKLYRNLGRVEAERSLSGWLYRVTANACHDLRRRKPLAAPEEAAAEIPSAAADPQSAAVEAERRRVVRMSLRMLSERERAALVLRDLEGLTTEEVARALGSTEATVRSHIWKARVKMKDFVERYFRRRS